MAAGERAGHNLEVVVFVIMAGKGARRAPFLQFVVLPVKTKQLKRLQNNNPQTIFISYETENKPNTYVVEKDYSVEKIHDPELVREQFRVEKRKKRL